LNALRPIPLSRGLKTALTALVFLPFLTSGDDRPTLLEQVQQRGSLTMLTRNGASTYYIGPEGPTGPEVELVRAFTDYLGVDLDIQVARAFNQLSGMLQRREGELISTSCPACCSGARAN
jgi:membrane-bound lytic murein transglycosylase F